MLEVKAIFACVKLYFVIQFSSSFVQFQNELMVVCKLRVFDICVENQDVSWRGILFLFN